MTDAEDDLVIRTAERDAALARVKEVEGERDVALAHMRQASREATQLRGDLCEIAKGCRVGCPDETEAKRRIIAIATERDALKSDNERLRGLLRKLINDTKDEAERARRSEESARDQDDRAIIGARASELEEKAKELVDIFGRELGQ